MKRENIQVLVLMCGVGWSCLSAAADWSFEQYLEVTSSSNMYQASTGAGSVQAGNLVVKSNGMQGDVDQTATFKGTAVMSQHQVNGSTQAVNSLNHR